jgi:hypothetical protein
VVSALQEGTTPGLSDGEPRPVFQKRQEQPGHFQFHWIVASCQRGYLALREKSMRLVFLLGRIQLEDSEQEKSASRVAFNLAVRRSFFGSHTSASKAWHADPIRAKKIWGRCSLSLDPDHHTPGTQK